MTIKKFVTSINILIAALLALVAVASSKNINLQDLIDLEDNTAFGYHAKIGVPLAEQILADETQQVSDRIVGGNAAELGQFPYQAGIVIDLPSNQRSVCGGSILNNRKVLTAAHCWWDGRTRAWRFSVVAGSLTIFFGGERHVTTNVEMHASWNPYAIRDDIAIVTVNSPITFSGYVSPITLPSGSQLNENYVGAIGTASGYGRTGDGTAGAIGHFQALRYVTLPVITNEECARSFAIVTPNTLCASGANNRATCNGDSGGPFTVIRNNRPIIVGITAFGSSRSCHLGIPVGFVRVSSYIGWIIARL